MFVLNDFLSLWSFACSAALNVLVSQVLLTLHLKLPSCTASSKKVCKFLAYWVKSTYFSLYIICHSEAPFLMLEGRMNKTPMFTFSLSLFFKGKTFSCPALVFLTFKLQSNLRRGDIMNWYIHGVVSRIIRRYDWFSISFSVTNSIEYTFLTVIEHRANVLRLVVS